MTGNRAVCFFAPLFLLLALSPPATAQTSPGGRWGLSLRGGYDPLDFDGETHRGAFWGAVRYDVKPGLQVVGEIGFNRYRYHVEPEGWAVGNRYRESRETTDFIPLAVGLRIMPFQDAESWPFLEVLPTLFRSRVERISENGTFGDGGARIVDYRHVESGSALKAGLQIAGGFHLVTPPPGGIEFGFRAYLVSNDDRGYGLIQPAIEGQQVSDPGFPVGVQRFFIFGGLTFDL